ncbi:amidohydrolase [Herbiconiux sp. L3-i23]|uniref:amidohydrolase n=1 Tax=Herbiconiux sp. L3-i23 TaxID=2905871 RepID=UPI00204E98EB|nr:amidohydrolase family protein [Herbiconiux sp. L3-i23]BDI23214.1 amidohydrolase [Herbiconiux sp. L3-i23]
MAERLLLRNARVRGVARPGDILLEDGLIVGLPGDAADRVGTPTEVIDLEGRFVLPGLWDQHVHFTQLSLMSRRLDVSAASSAFEAATMVSASLADAGAPAGPDTAAPGTIIGYGFRDGLWPDAPNSRLLDQATGGGDVVLISGDLHCVWLSTRAAANLGVEIDDSGLLREGPAFAVQRALDEVPEHVVDGWAADAAKRAAARGVVGVVDLEMDWTLDTWRRRRAASFNSLRVRFGVYPQHVERAIAEGLRTGGRIDDLIEVGYLKVLIDGSLNTRTAYCFDPYAGDPDSGSGLLTVGPDDLERLLRTGRSGGLVPTVHAIGDRALGLALDVFERLGIGGRVEHAQLVGADDVARFGRLGVVASVQPAHLLDDRDVADELWAGRTDRAFPLRSLLDAGASLALGSDAPVSALDPWQTIDAAVHRSRPGDQSWHPEQALTVEEALAASTDGRTRLQVGAPADLAVVDDDPIELQRIDPEFRLTGIPVAATLLAGRFTHRAL